MYEVETVKARLERFTGLARPSERKARSLIKKLVLLDEVLAGLNPSEAESSGDAVCRCQADSEQSGASLHTLPRRDFTRRWPDDPATMEIEVEPVAPGIGRIACPECQGGTEEYTSLFPPEIGIIECLNSKGTGYVYVNV